MRKMALLLITLALPAIAQKSELTVTEKLALSTLGEKEELLRKQQQELNQTAQKVLAEINANHPGYTFNVQTGQLEVKEEKKPESPNVNSGH